MIVILCGLSLHTHTHCMSWVVYLKFSMSRKNYLCWLKSQLSFISLLSFEMLSDCIINGLYMRVLKLTWEKLIFVHFPQFSVFQCEASGRSLLTSGLVDFRCPDDFLFESERAELSCPDGIWLRSDARSNQRLDGKDISSWRARPVRMVPRQRAFGRH
jgi:hypothetical protein